MTEDRRILAGRYQVGELIGRGGMSDVHKGVDSRLGRTVAIKLLKPALANDPAFRSRFRREAQAAARMAHPTIVRVFDAGEETVRDAYGNELQVPFIVMEYVDGVSVAELLRRGPLPLPEALRIVSGILTALEYSHRAGVVHRDIKAANVMIARGGQVKVMDFGIARAVSDGASSLAHTTAVLGTANYFSPEQAKGELVDARTDLYSTGVVLFEMLTGRVPFRGDTAVAVAYQHVSEIPPKPSQVNPHVSPAVDLVVQKALQKDRFERYQTAAEFREDVEEAAAGRLPIRKAPSGGDALFAPPQTGIARTQAAFRQLADDPALRRTQSRPPALLIWAGVLTVIVIVGLALFWVFHQTPHDLLADTSRTVPALVGDSQQQATTQIKGMDLTPEVSTQASDTVPAGTVISTDPEKGIVVQKGTPVTIVVSSGPPAILVPDVTDDDQKTAEGELTDAGFAIGSITTTDSPTVPAGSVISTNPATGKSGHKGDLVDVVISSGMVNLPNVVGQSVQDATTLLEGAKYELQVTPSPDAGCPTVAHTPVRSQSLPPGEVPQGASVTLTFCVG